MQSVVGREVTYNPARLSGVDVYRKSNRTLSQGDRVQFRAPFTEQRIANEELGSIGRITEEELTVALDSRREVSFELAKFITLNRSCEHTHLAEHSLMAWRKAASNLSLSSLSSNVKVSVSARILPFSSGSSAAVISI